MRGIGVEKTGMMMRMASEMYSDHRILNMKCPVKWVNVQRVVMSIATAG